MHWDTPLKAFFFFFKHDSFMFQLSVFLMLRHIPSRARRAAEPLDRPLLLALMAVEPGAVVGVLYPWHSFLAV